MYLTFCRYFVEPCRRRELHFPRVRSTMLIQFTVALLYLADQEKRIIHTCLRVRRWETYMQVQPRVHVDAFTRMQGIYRWIDEGRKCGRCSIESDACNHVKVMHSVRCYSCIITMHNPRRWQEQGKRFHPWGIARLSKFFNKKIIPRLREIVSVFFNSVFLRFRIFFIILR